MIASALSYYLLTKRLRECVLVLKYIVEESVKKHLGSRQTILRSEGSFRRSSEQALSVFCGGHALALDLANSYAASKC